MLIGFVYKPTDTPIYTYDTALKIPIFLDKSLERMMSEAGITLKGQDAELKRKTVKLSEPDFHHMFVAYSKVEYDSAKFYWKVLKY